MKAREANKGSDDGDSELREHVGELLMFKFDLDSIFLQPFILVLTKLVAIVNNCYDIHINLTIS